MADDFAVRYAGLLTGSYDCVDRIVLNAYYPMGNTAGGFRTWWRRLIGGGDAEADAVLDNTHLMRLAGRFARRVRAWAADNAVPVIDCTAGERKHLIAEEYLRTHSVSSFRVRQPGPRWSGCCRSFSGPGRSLGRWGLFGLL